MGPNENRYMALEATARLQMTAFNFSRLIRAQQFATIYDQMSQHLPDLLNEQMLRQYT